MKTLNNQYDVEPIGVNCKYYQIYKLHRKIVKNSKFSLLHLNIASLGTHNDEFEDMLLILDLNLDIFGLTGTRLIKDQSPIFKTFIDGYEEYHIPTESTKGGSALYINKSIVSKPSKDLEKNHIFLKNLNLLLLKF